jgi:hypothetical protein
LGEICQEIPWVHEEGRENTFSLLTERKGYKEVLKWKGIGSGKKEKKERNRSG